MTLSSQLLTAPLLDHRGLVWVPKTYATRRYS